MISYSETKLAESYDYLYDNMHEHYADMLTEGEPLTLELDTKQVMQLEDAGMFTSVVAIQDGEKVGLISGYIGIHLQHKYTVFAATTLLNAKKSLPTMRKIKIIKGLIKAFEELCRDKYNAEYVQVSLSYAVDIRKVVERLGYKFTDYVLTKRVK